MLSARMYGLLEAVARLAKGSTAVFGGVRLIFVGDVAQLPPVPGLDSTLDDAGDWVLKKKAAQYAFESLMWQRCQFNYYKLSHCWRYDINSRLGRFLTELRVAKVLGERLFGEMEELWTQKTVNSEEAVILCCTNVAARQVSLNKLRKLHGLEVTYCAVDRHSNSGSDYHVNTEADDESEARQARMQFLEQPTFVDEDNNLRSLFGSLSQPAIVHLRVGAKVLGAQVRFIQKLGLAALAL